MGNEKELLPAYSGKMKVEGGSRDIYWEYYGNKEKEAVCLLNGLAMDTRAWRGVVPQVYPEYDVLLFNYLGQEAPDKESSCLDEPYYISHFAEYLKMILDHLEIEKLHVMGVSYGGFVAADFGRLFQDRMYTLTMSGILLKRHTLFQQYQDLSLMFYKRGDEIFEVYTHFMYEKIFGENFAEKIYGDTMKHMQENFFGRYNPKKHCLIRLTEAQNPFFENIDNNPDCYSEIKVPTLMLTGEQDRAVPIWFQAEIPHIIPDCVHIMIPESGHLTYLERPDIFWPNLRNFMKEKSTDFTRVNI